MNKLQTLLICLAFLLFYSFTNAQEGAAPDSKSKFSKCKDFDSKKEESTAKFDNPNPKKFRTADAEIIKPNYNKTEKEPTKYVTRSDSQLSSSTKIKPKTYPVQTKEELKKEIESIESDISKIQSSSDIEKEAKLEKLNRLLVKKNKTLKEK